MEENNGSKKYGVYPILLSIFGIILIILVGTYTYIVRSNYNANGDNKALVLPTEVPTQGDSSLPMIAPKVLFSQYVKSPRVVMPSPPSSVKKYYFKTPLTDVDVDAIARSLGVQTTKRVDDSYVTYYNVTPGSSSMGYLEIDKTSGQLTFQSYGVHRGDTAVDFSKEPGRYVLSL